MYYVIYVGIKLRYITSNLTFKNVYLIYLNLNMHTYI